MKTINIFCILAKTGAGKSKFMNELLNDKKFINSLKLKSLVYGTTRNIRPGEKEGVDYYFHSRKEYEKIKKEDLIEFRSYYTINDGEIFYFTKSDYFDTEGNIICITSPYQYEYYRNWCNKQNLKKVKKYNLNMIILDSDLKTRVNRLSERASKDDDIYEFCRRIVEERSEFDNVSTRVPELIDPMQSTNVCYINNNSDNINDFNKNILKIKEFLRENIN